MNKIIISGNIAQDIELAQTKSGVSVCRFSVAVRRRFEKDEQGNYLTDFFQVTAWRQTAEFVAKYFKKGSGILVEGELNNDKWTDKQGNNRITATIQASNVEFFGGKKDENAQAQPAQAQNQYTPASYSQPQFNTTAPAQQWEQIQDDSELPF